MVAGSWTYKKFIRTREDFPSIDVTVGLDPVGEHLGLSGPVRLTVVTATVKNAGTVRHKMSNLHFDMRVILNGDLLTRSDVALGQADFPHKIYDKQRFFPTSWVWSFVEPGATNVYRYSALVPTDAKFALLSVRLPLEGEDEFVTSWRVFNLSP